MNAATMNVRVSDGTRLPYVVQGDPHGVPVVLLHAVAESWCSFSRLLPLLPQTVRAFAVTQRGHGAAGKPSDGYRLDEAARDVADFMTGVGLDRAVVVGSSSGGYVAQRFAADHPERAAGLVLIGSPRSLRGIPVPGWVDAAVGLQDPVPEDFVRESITSFAVYRPLPPAFLEQMIEAGLQCPAHVWRAVMRGLLEAAAPTETGRIVAPTVVIWGERDEFLPRAEEEALVGAIPGAELVVHEDTGHLVLWERPDRVAADVMRLVERIRPPLPKN